MTTFPELAEADRIARLEPPTGRIRMVLDTDTYNEVDDQFAIVHALLSPDKLDVEAIYAAPFHNNRSNGPADGMERSYEEILRLFDRLGRSPDGLVYRGAMSYLPEDGTPIVCDAVRDLVARGMASDEPLYVVALGAITNVASALLMEPRLVEKIVVVWLGGTNLNWPSAREFNLQQDVRGAQVLFDCGVPLVVLPTMGVITHLHTTIPELDRYVAGQGAIGDYLVDIVKGYNEDHKAWSKVIWDVAGIAYLLNPDWVPTNLVHSPILTDQVTWSVDQSRHLVRYAYYVHRDPIFRDLFDKLAGVSNPTN